MTRPVPTDWLIEAVVPVRAYPKIKRAIIVAGGKVLYGRRSSRFAVHKGEAWPDYRARLEAATDALIDGQNEGESNASDLAERCIEAYLAPSPEYEGAELPEAAA